MNDVQIMLKYPQINKNNHKLTLTGKTWKWQKMVVFFMNQSHDEVKIFVYNIIYYIEWVFVCRFAWEKLENCSTEGDNFLVFGIRFSHQWLFMM